MGPSFSRDSFPLTPHYGPFFSPPSQSLRCPPSSARLSLPQDEASLTWTVEAKANCLKASDPSFGIGHRTRRVCLLPQARPVRRGNQRPTSPRLCPPAYHRFFLLRARPVSRTHAANILAMNQERTTQSACPKLLGCPLLSDLPVLLPFLMVLLAAIEVQPLATRFILQLYASRVRRHMRGAVVCPPLRK
jgi:hypothetical protein